ncbi:MAG: hypothetical protein KJ709_02020 [Nanoarchaeota archaeon]|nr:hypothetical protein [Nanoarchaeota archaeon]
MKPGFSEMGGLLSKITEGIENKEISTVIMGHLRTAMEQNPFAQARQEYEKESLGWAARKAKVFEPVEYGDRLIDPKSCIEELFNDLVNIYGLIIGRTMRSLTMIAEDREVPFSNQEEHKGWYKNFRVLLVSDLSLTADIAAWVYLVSKRPLAGKRFRDGFSKSGILLPEALSQDVWTLGQNLLSVYDAWEKKQLAKY